MATPDAKQEKRARGAQAMKRTLTPSKQTCIVLASLIGAGFVGGIGLYVWQSGEIASLQKEVTVKQEQVASGQKIASHLVSTEADYAETQKQLRTLETSVTAGQYVPTLLRQTEVLAKSVNLQVGAVRPTLEPAPLPPKDKEARKKFVPWPYDKIHIEMEVRGGYWNVAKLLYRLTNFPKILAVQSMQVQPSPNTRPGAAPQLTVNLKLTGFIFPDDGKQVAEAPGAGVENALASLQESAQSALPKAPPVVGSIGARASQGTGVVETPQPAKTSAPAPANPRNRP